MAESTNSSIPPTIDNSTTAAERRDRAHAHLGNQPHAAFGSKTPKNADSKGSDHLPPKLQARMERLMADLAALDEPDIYEPKPGDLVEVSAGPPSFDSDRVSQSGDSRNESGESGDRHNGSLALPEVALTKPKTAEIADRPAVVPFSQPAMLADKLSPESEASNPPTTADSVVMEDLPSLSDVSTSFSRQAREILEILKRRQDELSLQKNELELREAGMEKRIRQERMALAERQRQLEESLTLHQPVPAPNDFTNLPVAPSSDLRTAADISETTKVSETTKASETILARKITPEWIATNERLLGGSPSNHDGNFYAVIEEFVARQVRQEDAPIASLPTAAASRPLSIADHSVPASEPTPSTISVNQKQPLVASASEGRQQQAQQLRQQHETAIRSLRQTRRQLELLKDVLAQQQSQWSKQVDDVELYRIQFQEAHEVQQQQWLAGLEELERLRTIELNESAKRKTFLDQREAALNSLEERLQQSQVETLRDRVVLKQMERTIRQSMSNADWNQRWQVISEETQSYLKKVHEEAAALQSETKRRQERLESRKSEMLLYRESLRSWIERQMKLISRRVAHSEDRESILQLLSEEILVHRRDLKAQQDAMNELFGRSLELIDDQLDSASLPSQEAA